MQVLLQIFEFRQQFVKGNHLHVLAGVAENLKTTQFMLFNRASSSKHNASDHMGGMDCGELTLASQLQGLDHSLTVFDRAYFSAAFLLDWQTQGASRHWLMRAKRAFGAAVAFGFGDRSAGWLMLLGGVLMLAGVVLHLAESHGHEHTHEVLEHEYAHRHDDGHHSHVHFVMPKGSHSHKHTHEPMTHAHPHAPDVHHQYVHGTPGIFLSAPPRSLDRQVGDQASLVSPFPNSILAVSRPYKRALPRPNRSIDTKKS